MSLRNFPVGATRDNEFNRKFRNSPAGYNFPEVEREREPGGRLPFNEWIAKWTTPLSEQAHPGWRDKSVGPRIPSRVPDPPKRGKRMKQSIEPLTRERARTMSPLTTSESAKTLIYPNQSNWKLNQYGPHCLPTRLPGGIGHQLPEMPYF